MSNGINGNRCQYHCHLVIYLSNIVRHYQHWNFVRWRAMSEFGLWKNISGKRVLSELLRIWKEKIFKMLGYSKVPSVLPYPVAMHLLSQFWCNVCNTFLYIHISDVEHEESRVIQINISGGKKYSFL